MRAFLCALFLVFVTLATAWTKEDHEIFDLVSALEAAEGKGTTFYSWLNVSSSATNKELSKAYRELSKQLHPDKNPNLKNAQERFARLGVIGKILREKESRARYDFFYKNGVPTWRGTGYYYSRFRPGVGTVLVFLTLVSSVLQYIFQKMNYNRDVRRIAHICGEAKSLAWGADLTRAEKRKRVKVPLGPPRVDQDGNLVTGRTLDMAVDPSGDVFIVESDGSLTQLDASHATPPALTRTWAIALVRWAVDEVRARVQGGAAPAQGAEEDEDAGSTGLEDTPYASDASDAPKAVKSGGRKERRAEARAARKRA